MLLEMKPQKGMGIFLAQCQKMGLNPETIYRAAVKTITHLNGTAQQRAHTEVEQTLERCWYDALARGEIAWNVYDSELYFAELWACWIVYSRTYLRAIRKPKSLPPYGIVRDCQPVKHVIDLGCGIGYTTAALRELFPKAAVTGTNLANTLQFKFLQSMMKLFDFDVVSKLDQIDKRADLVIAFEYFEHIPDPIKHLGEVVLGLSPRAMLIANSFGTKGIGHFDRYGGSDAGDMSKLFNLEMNRLGYQKIKTGLWNNRPAYWRLKS